MLQIIVNMGSIGSIYVKILTLESQVLSEVV